MLVRLDRPLEFAGELRRLDQLAGELYLFARVVRRVVGRDVAGEGVRHRLGIADPARHRERLLAERVPPRGVEARIPQRPAGEPGKEAHTEVAVLWDQPCDCPLEQRRQVGVVARDVPAASCSRSRERPGRAARAGEAIRARSAAWANMLFDEGVSPALACASPSSSSRSQRSASCSTDASASSVEAHGLLVGEEGDSAVAGAARVLDRLRTRPRRSGGGEVMGDLGQVRLEVGGVQQPRASRQQGDGARAVVRRPARRRACRGSARGRSADGRRLRDVADDALVHRLVEQVQAARPAGRRASARAHRARTPAPAPTRAAARP